MATKLQPVLWKKRILVPFWIVRICLMVLNIAAMAWLLRNQDQVADIDDLVHPNVA